MTDDRGIKSQEAAGRGWLEGALHELDQAAAYARSGGHEPVSGIAVAKARSLLMALAAAGGDPPIVGPTPEGGIAIEFRTAARDGLLLVCEPDGAGAYFVTVGSRRTRGRCSDVSDLMTVASLSGLTGSNVT